MFLRHFVKKEECLVFTSARSIWNIYLSRLSAEKLQDCKLHCFKASSVELSELL